MRILVTGGLGFIGHKVVKLLQPNNEVIVYDSMTDYGILDRTELAWLHKERTKGITGNIVRADIRNEFMLRQTFFMDQPNVVVHMASFPRAKVVDADPMAGSQVMVTALLRLLKECEMADVRRFVYISSSMVYGNFKDRVTEDAICAPQGPYAIMKYMGELLVKDFCTRNKMEYVIVRPSAVYGPLDVEDRVVSKFLVNAMNDRPITVKGIRELLDFTYVDDIANGIMLAATMNQAANNTYNMTRGHSYTLLEAAKMIKEITNSSSGIIRGSKDKNFPSRGALSIKKAGAELGYIPTTDIKEGFQLYYEWLKESSIYCPR